ncbi:MAG: xylulose kinase [Isosphaera sp.]|nr:xylulose kinase [Isosphaera sp.]
MPEPLLAVPPSAVVVGYDFSTGGVKAVAFDTSGNTVAAVRLPTDLWTDGGVSELNLMQLEGQARAATRLIADELRRAGRLADWRVAGVSATHHSAGRVDARGNQVRRAICWNDQTLAKYHAEGLRRLGGQARARELTGGPWAVRYSLSHLVKDEETLPPAAWERTALVVPHGPLAAGYLTGNFRAISVSSAASTGIMDLRTNAWSRGMLDALAKPENRARAWECLPPIRDAADPVGPLSESIALDADLPPGVRPIVFPTLDDQAAGLIGGGAVDAGHVAVILGNSAVVNASSAELPRADDLDAMKLNWGPYLWMRCYSNGAQFLDRVVGPNRTADEWAGLTAAAEAVPAGCGGTAVLPFLLSEPSLGVTAPRFRWFPAEPTDRGVRVRASFEAIAYLIALGVRAHESAGQVISRVTVSGGIARNDLMVRVLASVLDRPLDRLVSDEGTALGAAVAALAGAETHGRQAKGVTGKYTAADAVAAMVRFRDRVGPVGEWVGPYRRGLAEFEGRLRGG